MVIPFTSQSFKPEVCIRHCGNKAKKAQSLHRRRAHSPGGRLREKKNEGNLRLLNSNRALRLTLA